MRAPMTIAEFSRLARVSIDELQRYKDEGLLDPDGDGLFDEYDAIRIHIVGRHVHEGRSVAEISELAREGTIDPFFADLLYGQSETAIPFDEAAERLGFTSAQLRNVGTASGLSLSRAIDQQDFEALSGVKMMIDQGIPYEAILEIARVMGDAFRRIADSEVRLMHDFVHEPLAREGMSDREIGQRTRELMDMLGPITDRSLLFLHRQFLLRSIARDVIAHFEAGGAQTPVMEAAIVFVDLSSFTVLSQVHGDEEAAAILDRLDGLVRGLVLDNAGALVKQIGDAFMLTFEDPADAVRFSVAVAEVAAREERFPEVRIGMHAGPVLYRVGDYVGNTVNVASRVSSAAAPGEILMTEPVAGAARAAGIEVEQVGVRLLRGIEEPLTLHRVARGRRADRDPVCGMTVGADAAARLSRNGTEYVFCSEECLRRFVESPERYTAAAGA